MRRQGLVIAGFLAGCASTVAGIEQPRRECRFTSQEPLICTSTTQNRIYGRFRIGEDISIGEKYLRVEDDSGRLRLRLYDQNCSQMQEREIRIGGKVELEVPNPSRRISFAIHNRGPVGAVLAEGEIVVLVYSSVEGVCGRNCSNEEWDNINGEVGDQTTIRNPTATFTIRRNQEGFEIYPQSPPREFIGPYLLGVDGGEADYHNFGLEIERVENRYRARVRLCNVF
jgi:hypothetical protein